MNPLMVKCPQCKGEGEIICPIAKDDQYWGKQHLDCPFCEEKTGRLVCPKCEGKGRLRRLWWMDREKAYETCPGNWTLRGS